jgi:hypothetical protein
MTASQDAVLACWQEHKGSAAAVLKTGHSPRLTCTNRLRQRGLGHLFGMTAHLESW